METHDDKIKKSLKYSIIDGTFAASMIGFGESFFAAFAVFLKANNIQLGLLSSLPLTIGSLSQLLSNKLIKLFNSRKKFVYIMALFQGLMYIPIALVFFFGELRVFHLIFFTCLYWIFGMILGPAWNSWMGDLVDGKERGAYFGKRGKITGFAAFVSFLIAGYILQRFTGSTATQYIGFVTIFCLALISRIISFIYLTKKYEPEYKVAHEAEFSFLDFVKQARFRNFGLFVIYLCSMNFSLYISAPFFTPYMLTDLKLDYLTFTIINVTMIIVKLFFMPVWGKASDRFGRKKVLSLTGFLMPITPLLWLFSQNIFYLIIIQIYSGFIWAGFEISSFNFFFDTTTSQKRATCVAYYNVINGVSILAGAMTGSLIVKYNSVFWSKYLLVFVVSCLLRYLASFIFIPRLREARPVEDIGYPRLFLEIISTMPASGLVYSLIPFWKKTEK